MGGDTATPARPPVAVRRRPAGKSDKPEPVRPAVTFAFLRLTYFDPEKKERDFPKGLEVDLTLSTADPKAKKRKAIGLVADGGVFTAPVHAGEEKLEIRFVFKDAVYVAVEAQGAALAPGETVMAKNLEATLRTSKRLFRIPSGLGLDNAPWKLEPADAKFHQTGKAVVTVKDLKSIGTKDAPRKLVLRPVWQYVRLTYFDRSQRGPEQISTLPLLLEGHHVLADVKKTPVAEARWNLGADDQKAVQCVPWILNRAGGKSITPPDKHSVLQLKTKAGTFIETARNKKRGLTDLSANPAVSRTANADRLRFYDLPAVWRSAGWYVRNEPKGASAGKLYENLGAGNFAGTLDKPLIFSLDDLVLVDGTLKPIAFTNRSPESGSTPNDRWAVFHHGFTSDTDLGSDGLFRRGIAKPDSDGDFPYFSEKPAVHVPGPRICEYPDWSRLVLAKGNAFDVFDRRTPDDANNKVVGARAAVNWIDATTTFPGITTWKWVTGDPNPHQHPRDLPVPGYVLNPNGPSSSQTDFFAIQPHYGQEYVQSTSTLDAGSYNFLGPWSPAGGARATLESIGRYDMIALRCCDAAGDQELGVCLMYFRFFWRFAGVSRPAAIRNDPAKRKAFVKKAMKVITDRWNGPDGNNPGAPRFVRKVPAGKLELAYACVAHSLPEVLSHFRMDVVDGGGGARDWMNSNGTGELTEGGIHDEGGGSMAAPHEAGHGLSLPDEYSEKWTLCSYGSRPLRSNNAIGDPFGDDPQSLMSYKIRDVRGRHYWHVAEWLRKLYDGDWKVEHGGMDYELPKHSSNALGSTQNARTFAYWPMRAEIATQSGGGKYEVQFYALGKDAFSQTVLPAADGVLVVQLKMRVSVPPDAHWPKRRTDPAAGKLGTHGLVQDVLSKLENKVNVLNGKFVAKGKVGVRTFTKIPMVFQARWIVDTMTTETYKANKDYLKEQEGSPQTAATYAAAVAKLVAANDAHLKVEVVSPPPPPPPPRPARAGAPPPPPPPPPPPVVSGWVGAGKSHLKLRLDELNKFAGYVVEFLGFTDGAPNPSPNKANAKVIASKVLTDADIL